MSLNAYESVCRECGRVYNINLGRKNPYFCPDCDEVRIERIDKSFDAIMAKFKEKKQ